MPTNDPAPAAETTEERQGRGEEVIRTLNAGQHQPVLEGLREEVPFLAAAITGYAIGDVWGLTVLDNRTR